jgi:hypothetical protein
MPSPGAGSVTSLSYMAQFLRSKSNNPSQGFAAGGQQRDITRYQETFQRPGSIFGPGYPLVPPSRQLVRGWDYPVSWNTSFRPRSYEPIGFGELRSLADARLHGTNKVAGPAGARPSASTIPRSTAAERGRGHLAIGCPHRERVGRF